MASKSILALFVVGFLILGCAKVELADTELLSTDDAPTGDGDTDSDTESDSSDTDSDSDSDADGDTGSEAQTDTETDDTAAAQGDTDTGDPDTGTGQADSDTGEKPGESCSNPIALTQYQTYTLTGSDFDADWAHDLDFNGRTSCYSTTNLGADVVFSIAMLADDSLWIAEKGTLDAVIRVISTCNDTSSTCLISNDSPEHEYFTATSAGTYYIIVENYSAPGDTALNFDIEIEHLDATSDLTERVCDDYSDDDQDGLADCIDEDCYTDCGTVVLLDETFDTQIPSTWAIYELDSNTNVNPDGYTWEWCSSGCYSRTNGTESPSGAGHALVKDIFDKDLHDERLVMSLPSTAGYTQLRLIYYTNFWDGLSSDTGKVYASRDGSATYDVISSMNFTQSGYRLVTIPSTYLNATDLRLWFVYSDLSLYTTTMGGWQIDDIKVLAW